MFTSLLLLQEDVPDEFASLIINFISRNRIGPNGVEVSNSCDFVWDQIFFSYIFKLIHFSFEFAIYNTMIVVFYHRNPA